MNFKGTIIKKNDGALGMGGTSELEIHVDGKSAKDRCKLQVPKDLVSELTEGNRVTISITKDKW